MTDANPGPNEEWRNYNGGNPFAQANIPIVILDEEENSEEEPEEADLGEDSEEYVPYGYEDEHDSEIDADEIPQDAQDTTEILTDDEITPPPPSPQPMRCCPKGKCPLTRHTARMSVPPATQQDELGFTPFPFRKPQLYRHFEIGGPSQVPLPAVAPSPLPAVAPSPPPVPAVTPPRDAPTLEQHNQVANQVLQLGDKVAADSDALQTLYCRVGADHSHANTAGAHIRALEYRLEIAEQELRSSERERLQIRSQLEELTRFVRRRLG